MNQPADWRVDWDRVPAQLVEVIRAAVGSIGIAEVPPGSHSNSSPDIDRWNAAAGSPVGSRYCVAFCYSMYALADGGNPLPRTGSVEALANWGREHGKLVHAGALMPGDIGCILGEGPNGDEHHHAVMVVADLGDGRAAVVEANHRDEVCANIRGGREFASIVRAVGVTGRRSGYLASLLSTPNDSTK